MKSDAPRWRRAVIPALLAVSLGLNGYALYSISAVYDDMPAGQADEVRRLEDGLNYLQRHLNETSDDLDVVRATADQAQAAAQETDRRFAALCSLSDHRLCVN